MHMYFLCVSLILAAADGGTPKGVSKQPRPGKVVPQRDGGVRDPGAASLRDGGAKDAGAGVDAGANDAGAGVDAGAKDAGVGVADSGAAAVVPDAGATPAALVKKPLVLDVEEVVFHAKTPAVGIDGTTKKMTAMREGELVRFQVPLDGIDTGIGLRNSHMKNYLDAATHPNAELVVAFSLLKPGVGQRGKGTFTVKGVAREVELAFDVKKVPSGFAVQAKFAIDLKNHGVSVPVYAGITVKKDVTIEALFVISE